MHSGNPFYDVMMPHDIVTNLFLTITHFFLRDALWGPFSRESLDATLPRNLAKTN